MADDTNAQVWKITPTGDIMSVAGTGTPGYAGDGGPARIAQLDTPRGLAIDAAGNLFIADMGNHRVRKVSSEGTITTVAGDGNVAYRGDGGPASLASLNFPAAVAVDALGNLYIADSRNHSIRKVVEIAAPGVLAGRAFPGSGDVNQDGRLGIDDVILALRTVVHTQTLSPDLRAFADANGDGVLDLGDVTRILREVVGLTP